jgi:putative inorganic carbon (hco3(-)) transporter
VRDTHLQSNSIGFLSRIPVIVFWLIAASLGGIFIATQSPGMIIIVASVIAFAVLATISPLAAIIILLILAPMRTLIATEAVLQLPVDIGQIALIGLIIAWASQRIAHREPLVQTFWNPVSIVVLLYLILIGFTAFSSTSLSAWLNEWLKWLQILVLITFALSYGGDRRWEWLLFGLTFSAVSNALVGIYEFFGGSGALHLLINDKYFRAFGTFGQPNPFGGFMGLVAPITLMAMLGYGKRLWEKWGLTQQFSSAYRDLFLVLFYGLATIIILAGIGMSWSRGGWFGLIGALLIVALALPRNTWRGLTLFVAIFGSVTLLWFAGIVPRSVIERLTTSTQEFFAFEDVRGIDITPENYAVAERLAHWQAAINMFTDNPWLGVGLGNYEVVYPDFRLINWQESLGHAHNYYLNILAEGGILGFLAYGKVWVVIIALSWRGRSHPDTLARFVVIGLMGSWAYLAIHSFFDNLYVNNLFLHIGLMFGMVAILYNQTRTYIRLGIQ